MENLYGIGITNRYQLFLNEDEDPLEVLKSQEQEKELKKKTKLSEKENKGKQQETKGKPVVNPRKGIKETQNIKSQDQQHKAKEETVKAKGPARGPAPERKFNNENREERNNQRNRPDKQVNPGGGDFQREDRGERRFERRPTQDGDGPREGGRGRPLGAGPTGRGMGRGRGRGGRGGFDGRGKREFDRQSGSDKTGIKAVDKRDGAGAHNWGSHREAIDDMDNVNRPSDDSNDWADKPDNEVAVTEPTDTKEVTEGAGQNGVEGEEGEGQPSAEEERKELTLDEWKALKGNRTKPQYNLRKAGEGEDLSQWKKMYALQKKKEEEDEDEEEEYDSSDYPQRVGRQKLVLDIEFTFPDARVGGRGRGGRGAGRGAPRGGPRGPPRGSSSDDGPAPRDAGVEREPGPYGGPRNSRPSAPKPREREPGSYAGPRNSSRQSAPKAAATYLGAGAQ